MEHKEVTDLRTHYPEVETLLPAVVSDARDRDRIKNLLTVANRLSQLGDLEAAKDVIARIPVQLNYLVICTPEFYKIAQDIKSAKEIPNNKPKIVIEGFISPKTEEPITTNKFIEIYEKV